VLLNCSEIFLALVVPMILGSKQRLFATYIQKEKHASGVSGNDASSTAGKNDALRRLTFEISKAPPCFLDLGLRSPMRAL